MFKIVPRHSAGWAISMATFCLGTSCFSTAWAAEPSIVPRPATVVEQKGSMTIADGTAIVVPQNDPDAKATAAYLVDLVARTRGIKLSDQRRFGKNTVGDRPDPCSHHRIGKPGVLHPRCPA